MLDVQGFDRNDSFVCRAEFVVFVDSQRAAPVGI
jgi:hypothetical protein